MERITEALQRARQARSFERVGFVEGLRPVSGRADGTQTAVEKIIYTQTRTSLVTRDALAERLIVSGFDRCIFTDAFKILSTQVSQKLRENHWSTVSVTSPNEREGKTLVAINLAISLAMEFQETALLVDADLRQPEVRNRFGLETGPGLSDYLVSGMPLEQILVHPGIDSFVILPGGSPLPNSSEMLGSPKMAQLVAELRDRYASRVIVFDLPPLLHSADVLAFAPHVEAALLVAEEGKTRCEEIARAAELLNSTHLIGTVLNKSTELRIPEEERAG